MTIAILRFSSIGDIIMTTAAVRCLRKAQPDARIVFVTKPQYASLVAHNPYVDEVITLDGSLVGLAWRLWRAGITHVADLHANLRSRLLSALLLRKTYRVDKGTAERQALIADKSKRPQALHMADRHIAALAKLGVVYDGLGLDLIIPLTERVTYATISFAGQAAYTAVCIGGQHNTKKLPVEKLDELLRSIATPIVLLGGAEDADIAARAAGALAMEGRWDIHNACGQLSLLQTASVIEQSVEVYTHDTGMMHMAAALKKTVHSIWGATVPAFGMYPFGTDFTVVKVSHLYCQPCHRHGSERCPQGHFRCMLEQDFSLPRQVYNTGSKGTREQMVELA